jgi:hypothetical protein
VVEVPTPAQTGRFGVFHLFVPQWPADADGSAGGTFPNGSFVPKIAFARQSRAEFRSVVECCPCETAGSKLRNVPFEGL